MFVRDILELIFHTALRGFRRNVSYAIYTAQLLSRTDTSNHFCKAKLKLSVMAVTDERHGRTFELSEIILLTDCHIL